MERIGPLTAEEETALEALHEWLNVKNSPNRTRPDSFSLHVRCRIGDAFRREARTLLRYVRYGHMKFREEEYADKDGNTHVITYLDARRMYCALRKTA